MGVIYKITSPSGRVYVGKSINLKKRIKDYKYQSKARKSIIHDSIRGYGWDNHKLEIIEECANELLSEREIYWIKELNSYWEHNPDGGMNMTKGGEAGGGSWMWDTERRKYFSDLFKGEGSPFYGKKHTEETKRYLGEVAKQRNLKTEHRVPKWGAEKGRLKIIKAVVCYGNDGNFISEYESANKAANELSINRSCVSDSLRLGTWSLGKHYFRYKTENYPKKIEVGKINVKTAKRPVYLLNDDLEPVLEFSSSKEASDFLGVPKTTINRAAMYNDMHPIRTGHIFFYKDMYLDEYRLVS